MDDYSKEIEELVFLGAFEFYAFDEETMEPLYKPTEKLKYINPKLHEDITLYFSETTTTLWQKGFIDMDITIEDPIVKLAEKSFNKEELLKLDKNERVVMGEISRVLSQRK
jgi:hypothetical protein